MTAAIVRSRVLPAVTILASAPLFLAVLLKMPPAHLEGYPFVFLWSWAVFGSLLTPVCLAAECALVLWCVFVVKAVPRGDLRRHLAATVIATLGLLMLYWARRI